MPIPKDYREIIKDLEQATKEARTKWRSNRFGVELSIIDSTFKMWSGDDEETGVPFISFALADITGKTLDTWYLEQGDEDFLFMEEFLDQAKKLANGVPDRLKRLKAELSSKRIIGEDPKDEEIPF